LPLSIPYLCLLIVSVHGGEDAMADDEQSRGDSCFG